MCDCLVILLSQMFFSTSVAKLPDSSIAAAFDGDGFASFVDPSDNDVGGVSFAFSIRGGGGGVLLRKGDFALEVTADGAALETVLYMEEDSIREGHCCAFNQVRACFGLWSIDRQSGGESKKSVERV